MKRHRHRSPVAIAGLAVTCALLASCSSEPAAVSTDPVVTFATSPPAGSPPATEAAASSTASPAGTDAAPPIDTGAADTGASTEPTQPAEPLGDPTLTTLAVGTFTQPVDLAWRADDPTMFVVQQTGQVVPVRDGAAGEPVLDIAELIAADGEQGLLGLTFDPSGAFAYLDFTDTNGDTNIVEVPVAADGTFDRGAIRTLMVIAQPYANHNGGNVMIGPDGFLYIGMGDGGAGGDPERRALNVSELLGKILRIDPRPDDGNEYTIPADNPFVGVPDAFPEIWSVGVRNPWRMSFDPATGDLWFGDVGQGDWEEIDVAWADEGAGRGMNFGWSALEGTHIYNPDQSADGAVPPIFEYQHGDAGCSVSGGTVAHDPANPALDGWYVFGDYCSGQITALQVADRALVRSMVLTNVGGVSAVRSSPTGELYASSVNGDVVQLIPA